MATLPDINTDEVSFLAYWNAIDQGGVDSIGPEETLEDSDIVDYTLYDNGWEGKYSLYDGREASVRVKNDGWFVVYIDDSESFDENVTDNDLIRGPWDIIYNWTQESSTGDMTNGALFRVIESLQSYLSADPTYDSSKVGLYNYDFGSATTVTHLSASDKVSNLEGETYSYGFSYTSETEISYAVATGSGDKDFVDSSSDDYGQVIFEDYTYLDASEEGSPVRSVYDVLDEHGIPDSGTEYTIENGHSYGRDSADNVNASHNLLVVWS